MDALDDFFREGFAIVLVVGGAYTIYWAATRQSHEGRVRGRLRRWKHTPLLLGLAALFVLWAMAKRA